MQMKTLKMMPSLLNKMSKRNSLRRTKKMMGRKTLRVRRKRRRKARLRSKRTNS